MRMRLSNFAPDGSGYYDVWGFFHQILKEQPMKDTDDKSTLREALRALDHKTMYAADKHGTPAVRSLLRTFNVDSTRDLTLRNVAAYTEAIDKLADSPVTSEVAFQKARGRHSEIATVWSDVDRDRQLFEAGRAHGRKEGGV